MIPNAGPARSSTDSGVVQNRKQLINHAEAPFIIAPEYSHFVAEM